MFRDTFPFLPKTTQAARLAVTGCIQGLRRGMSTRSPLIEQERSGWYAGMAIEPANFTEQLASLQMSLQRENAVSAQAVAVAALATRVYEKG